jgi:hypothetical protein
MIAHIIHVSFFCIVIKKRTSPAVKLGNCFGSFAVSKKGGFGFFVHVVPFLDPETSSG